MIGGRAVQFHGHWREAKDLDLLVECSAENWPKLNAALRPLNAEVKAFEELAPERKYQAKLHFYPTVEFVTQINNVSFAEAWDESDVTTVEGLSVCVLSKPGLMLSKRGSTRQIDIDDIRALEKLSAQLAIDR